MKTSHSHLLNRIYIYLPTNERYIVYSVRENENENHKLYLENTENSDEQLTYYLFDLQNSKDFEQELPY